MKSLSFVFGLALVSTALSQQPPPQQASPAEAPDAKKPGVLAGQVVNAKTGEPVRRVNLTLRPFGAPGTMGSVSGAMAPAAPYAAASDAEGKFRIEKVEPGNYRLSAERQGFVRQEYGARGNSMMGTTVSVTAGQELKDLNFKLMPQAIVTGKVLDEEGEPLARAQVQAMRRRFYRGKQQLMPTGGGMTLDNGEFRLADLAPGRYWISATYRGRMMMMGEAPRNTSGQPEEEYVTTYYPGSIDEAGARPIDLGGGQEMSGIDIRMHKARVYRIRGKVVGGIRGMRVMLMPRERGAFMGMNIGGVMAKEDGAFEIGSVQPGSYYVTAMQMQGMMTPIGRTPVDVGQDDVNDVILTASGGATLKGGIRLDGDAQQQEQAQGKKITFGSVRVQLVPMEGMAFNVASATAKEDGSFTIENAGPDKYRVMVYNLPQGTWLKSIRAGEQEVLDSGIELSGGTAGAVEVVLGVGVGQVGGIVQDAKQQPAPGSMVTLVPDPMKEDRSDLYKVSSTDQNGRFTLQGIAPGDYRLYAWEEVEPGGYTDAGYLKPYEGSAKKITVKANSSEQVRVTQIPAEAPGTR